MSHKKHVEPPKVDHACDHTHDHVVCKSLTVKPEGNEPGPSVSLMANRGGAGIFASTGRGNECIGLWADAHQSPYLIIWGERAVFPPPLAITGEGLQLPDKFGEISAGEGHATVIPFADLLAAVRQVIKPGPQ
jgi:hypothetical protein